jgi:hypothetical protein
VRVIIITITIIIMVLQPSIVPWPFSSVLQSVGLLGRGMSPSQGLYLYIKQHKHRINTYNTDIHALSGIRTHDLSVRAVEDSSCLRLRGPCGRLCESYLFLTEKSGRFNLTSHATAFRLTPAVPGTHSRWIKQQELSPLSGAKAENA